MQISFHFDGEDYVYDSDAITVRQLDVIKSTFGFGFVDLQQQIGKGDPDALRALLWCAKVQSGKTAGDMRTYDFAVAPLFAAIQSGIDAAELASVGTPVDPPAPTLDPTPEQTQTSAS